MRRITIPLLLVVMLTGAAPAGAAEDRPWSAVRSWALALSLDYTEDAAQIRMAREKAARQGFLEYAAPADLARLQALPGVQPWRPGRKGRAGKMVARSAIENPRT